LPYPDEPTYCAGVGTGGDEPGVISDPNNILDRLDESVTLFDRQARFVYLNEAGIRPFGRPVEELLGKTPWELLPPTPRSALRLALEAVVAGGEKTTATTFIAALGRWYQADVYPHPVGALVLARDITERRRADEALRSSEARFRSMIEFAPDAILIYDPALGSMVDVNAEAERLFGKSRAEILGSSPLDLSAAVQRDGLPAAALLGELVRRIVEERALDFEWMIETKTGPVLVEVRARRLPETDPPLLLATVLDITARKRAHEQLAEVQRLEAVARLAGGVAHDFNNLLTIILGGAQMALNDLALTDRVRPDIVTVVDAAERAALVTRQLLAFARKQEVRPLLLDLSEYVERMRPVLARLVGEDVDITLDLARPLGSLLIDPAHVEQIVLNLAANARDAMPRGGHLTIATANVFLDHEYQRLHNGVPPGRYVMLTVSDTGEGIPEAVKPHIFEPFFTTKSLNRGTGLGLATVHGIVQQNLGHVWVYSEPGLGTSFKLYFPIVDGSAIATGSRPPGPEEHTGTETLLLVEDDDGVRQFLRRALQRGGYTVLEARNAGEALLIFEQHAGPVGLLVTDVVMPRMTGPQLVARLRAIRAELRVVYVSGYSEDRLDTLSSSASEAFLAKPISVDALLRCVREVLDR
jgi:two-component system cell cycle sensor histidine kinase/response regulator CckA